MSLGTYLEQEIRYIKWFSNRQGVSLEEGCRLWVQQGLAELYAEKFRTPDGFADRLVDPN